MEHLTHKELDNRIHTFLTRKFAELATVERIPRAAAWKTRPRERQKLAQNWGRA